MNKHYKNYKFIADIENEEWGVTCLYGKAELNGWAYVVIRFVRGSETPVLFFKNGEVL